MLSFSEFEVLALKTQYPDNGVEAEMFDQWKRQIQSYTTFVPFSLALFF